MAAEDKDGNRKGTHGERGRHRNPDESGIERPDRYLSGMARKESLEQYEELYQRLLAVLSRSDGWLRIVPGDDGKLVYIKYKWTLGESSGSYVMAVSSLWRINEALGTLTRKIAEVDAGSRKPTPDTFFRDRAERFRSDEALLSGWAEPEPE